MYHYIRNNEDYSYDCYCRRISEFECQIDFLSSRFEIVSPGDIEKIEYYLKRDDESACMLTFDDGYKEHYACSKFLNSKNLNGIFFPPINAINGELLDVNAIHCLIGERSILIDELLENILQQVKEKDLRIKSFQDMPISLGDYLKQGTESRYDDCPSTIFVKRLLQRDIISDSARRDVINECIKCFSNIDPSEFAKDLYLSVKEMQLMHSEGMYFGSHGLTHRWLNRLSIKEQSDEISQSFHELEKLELFTPNLDPKVMCYPFGAYNSDTVNLLIEENVHYSLTTCVGAATAKPDDLSMHQLKRWNTNDFWDNRWRKPCIPLFN